MNIGHRIKERRKLLKMSADELGRRLGKDRSTIYRYEKGDIENLPLDILEPIAKVLDTTPAYLMGWGADGQKRTEEDEKKPANDDGLTEAQRALMDFVLSVPEDKAARVLQAMRLILEDD